jgi:hypothetical protein
MFSILILILGCDLALHLILAVQKLVQLLMSTTGTMKNNP